VSYHALTLTPLQSASLVTVVEGEQTRWDPKGDDLCLGTVKPGEILVEAVHGANVQIARFTRV